MALLEDFAPVTTEQWEAVIQKDLKGADYEKRLVWQTSEGIPVRPYYRSEHLNGLEHLTAAAPGQFPYVRGTRATNDWAIREEIDAEDFAQANAAAKSALAAGVDEICFRRAIPQTLNDLRILLDGLDKASIRFESHSEVLVKLLIESAIPMRGSMNLHPFRDANAAASILRTGVPDFRPVTLNAAALHESGGTTVQEVGFALAAGIDYINQMTTRGLTVDQAANGVAFSFAIGSSYFFQIAKLRAFRMLWARAVQSLGGSEQAARAVIYARTARWNETIYDSFNNVLRGTTEAMSAVIAGVDALAVAPHDECYRTPDESSRRLARNTQIILRKESWLDRVADPAGGSYYVEVLTDSVARAAWKLMQEVESVGGYWKARESGMVPEQLAESRKKKEAAIASRRQVLVGTNNYPNTGEKMLDKIGERPRVDQQDWWERGGEIFEDIRLRTERHEAAGNKNPLFLLAEMGDLKMRKARSGFILNFFGCAGFNLKTEYFATPDLLVARANEIGADAIVLCSSDDEYPGIISALTTHNAQLTTPLIIAGNLKNPPPGIADQVHIRSNAVETLKNWQERLGVKG